MNLEMYLGCGNCFKTRNYPLRDDISKIKGKFFKRTMIILATPIYMSHVSSKMKILIERLSNWVHLLPLVGNKCISVIVTQNSGIDTVTSYLYEIYGIITKQKTTQLIIHFSRLIIL